MVSGVNAVDTRNSDDEGVQSAHTRKAHIASSLKAFRFLKSATERSAQCRAHAAAKPPTSDKFAADGVTLKLPS